MHITEACPRISGTISRLGWHRRPQGRGPMAKTFKPGLGMKIGNAFTGRIAERGKGPSFIHVVSIRGRKSGQVRSTPIDVMEVAGRRYLIAPTELRIASGTPR